MTGRQLQEEIDIVVILGTLPKGNRVSRYLATDAPVRPDEENFHFINDRIQAFNHPAIIRAGVVHYAGVKPEGRIGKAEVIRFLRNAVGCDLRPALDDLGNIQAGRGIFVVG